MQKEYLTQGFLQRLGNKGIIVNFLVNALSQETTHDRYLLFNRSENDSIRNTIQRILCEYYDPQICSDKMLDAYMILLFCELLRLYKSIGFSSVPSQSFQIVDVLEYIEANYLNATLRSAADHFGFHPNYFSAYIKKQTGHTFKDLVILQRMSQACLYLRNTDLSIDEIARKVGYENLGFFYKKFEDIYRVKPSVYRQVQSTR
jgi:YesN/AraC family two-component response regulator